MAIQSLTRLAALAVLATPLQAQWTLSPQPVVLIGSEASAEYQFDRIAHLRRLSDGRIVVTTGPDIRFFDAAGRYLAKAGGRGRGPGEYLYVSDLRVMPGDSLMTMNLRTVVVLDAAGKFVRQVQPDLAPLAEGGWFSEGSVLLPNGNLLAPQYSQQEGATQNPTLFRPKLRYAILDVRAARVIPLYEGGGIAQQYVNGRPLVLVFSPHAQYAVGADRVYVGDNDSTSIHAFDFAGTRLGTFAVADQPTPVAAAELEVEKQRNREWAERNSDPQWPFERMWEATPKPRRHPYWGTALVDATGALWVSGPPRTGDTPIAWTAFDRAGRRLGSLQMPARFTPKDIGDNYVLGVQRDEDGVETVTMYALHRR